MDSFHHLFQGFAVILTLQNLYYCVLGSLVGTLVGVLPGIGPLAALSLLLPVTFNLPAVSSVVMLAAIFYGAMYGGSTTSILVNIPGEAASVVTCLDGYEMAKQGRAGAALGMAAIASFIAGTLSTVGPHYGRPWPHLRRLTLLKPLRHRAALEPEARVAPRHRHGRILNAHPTPTFAVFVTAGSRAAASTTPR